MRSINKILLRAYFVHLLYSILFFLARSAALARNVLPAAGRRLVLITNRPSPFFFILVLIIFVCFTYTFFSIFFNSLFETYLCFCSSPNSDHICPTTYPPFGGRRWQYGAQEWIDFHRGWLECYDVHILEKAPKPRCLRNMWLPDWESVRFNEARARDIDYHKRAVIMWEKDLAAQKVRSELSEAVSYHVWKANWNNALAFFAYPSLIIVMVLWILAVVAK